jgi:hypothetical protein
MVVDEGGRPSDHETIGLVFSFQAAEVAITPEPVDDQYTTSAVDLFLGNQFRCWEERLFKPKGMKHALQHGSRGAVHWRASGDGSLDRTHDPRWLRGALYS